MLIIVSSSFFIFSSPLLFASDAIPSLVFFNSFFIAEISSIVLLESFEDFSRAARDLFVSAIEFSAFVTFVFISSTIVLFSVSDFSTWPFTSSKVDCKETTSALSFFIASFSSWIAGSSPEKAAPPSEIDKIPMHALLNKYFKKFMITPPQKKSKN